MLLHHFFCRLKLLVEKVLNPNSCLQNFGYQYNFKSNSLPDECTVGIFENKATLNKIKFIFVITCSHEETIYHLKSILSTILASTRGCNPAPANLPPSKKRRMKNSKGFSDCKETDIMFLDFISFPC